MMTGIAMRKCRKCDTLYTEPDAHFSLEEELCDTCIINFEMPEAWFEEMVDKVLADHEELLRKLRDDNG